MLEYIVSHVQACNHTIVRKHMHTMRKHTHMTLGSHMHGHKDARGKYLN